MKQRKYYTRKNFIDVDNLKVLRGETSNLGRFVAVTLSTMLALTTGKISYTSSNSMGLV